MWLYGNVDFNTKIIFGQKELSFYEEFFNYWYSETLLGKLKHDFSNYVWHLGKKCATLEEFWQECNIEEKWRSGDIINAWRIKNSSFLSEDFHKFANFKINLEVGTHDDFCCESQYLHYFVLPECYRLAQKRVGTLDIFIQRNKKAGVLYALEEYRDEIKDAMYLSFEKTQYAKEVQKTLKRRFNRVAYTAACQFLTSS
jgi:hypothetical protein